MIDFLNNGRLMKLSWVVALAAFCAAATARELDHSAYVANDSDFTALQDGIRAARRLRAHLFPNGISEALDARGGVCYTFR